MMQRGDSTRAVHAGLAAPRQGEPFLPGPVFAAPVHLRGDADPAGYGRFTNPTWEGLERAVGDLEGGEVVVFASGMAAVTAILLTTVAPGDAVVVPGDAYPGVREVAARQLAPRGVDVRVVRSDDAEVRDALAGARLAWIETPSNPGLRMLDVAGLARAAHAAGALLVADTTLATPLRAPALQAGADLVVASASKYLTGHSDLVLGYAGARDPARAQDLRAWRTLTGSIPGPFEAWLAHRSLATVGLRLERQEGNASALAGLLQARDDVDDVRWPGVGAVVSFDLRDAARAQAFLAACR